MAGDSLVLVVDDEESFRDIFSKELLAAGCRVETATNGEEGIAKARALRPKLVLMDLKMPVMDGAQAALILHDTPETTDIKVVFLTNFSNPAEEMKDADRQFARRFGAMEYIEKTDDLSAIVEKIKGYL
jgi:twitching motility two-component system response regulator PilH